MRRIGLALVLLLGGCDGEEKKSVNAAGFALPKPETEFELPVYRRRPGVIDPRRVDFDPADDNRLLVVDARGDVQVWDVRDAAAPQRSWGTVAKAIDAQFVRAGAIVVGTQDGAIELWRGDGVRLWRRDIKAGAVRAVAARGDWLVGGTADGEVAVWTYDGRLRARGVAHEGAVLSIAVAPDERRLATQGADTLTRSWRLRGNEIELVRTLGEVQQSVAKMLPNLIRWDVQWGWDRALAYSEDGRRLYAAVFDGTVRSWTTDGVLADVLQRRHRGHHVRAIAVVDRRLATAGLDGTARVSSLVEADRPMLLAHKRAVTSVDLAGDGRAASAGVDGTVRLWGKDGSEVGSLPVATQPPRAGGTSSPATPEHPAK